MSAHTNDRIAFTPTTSRRAFLGTAAAASAAMLVPAAKSHAQQSTTTSTRNTPTRARNVIVLVADGMSQGTLMLAHQYTQRTYNQKTNWLQLITAKNTTTALMSTHSADSLVTDSAAAGSTWNIGHKVNNRSINHLPSGQAIDPIFTHAKRAGRAVGVVTTTRLTHATPAAFTTTSPHRDLEDDIARSMLQAEFDVFLGGGSRHFFKLPADTLASYYQVRTRDELISATSRQGINNAQSRTGVLGLFNSSHMSYELDRSASEPSIAEMTDAALRLLGDSRDGFCLMVEGGRVDHAAHANDAPSLIAEQIAFDQAVGSVRRFADGRDDTLVIVTTDHGNANPGCTLYGSAGNDGLDLIRRARHSFEWLLERLEKDPSAQTEQNVIELIGDALGLSLSTQEAGFILRAARGEAVDAFRQNTRLNVVLGAALSNHYGIAFLSPNHTADHVELVAFGPGSELIPPFVDNTDLHSVIARAMSLDDVALTGRG